jgi:hypothetical protein
MEYIQISRSKVAFNKAGKGVVQFYGGQFFGNFPLSSYEYFFSQIYEAGYTLIVTPFQFGTNHLKIAAQLLHERDTIRDILPQLHGLTHFWLGHSLGCKFITLLEAWTDKKTNRFSPDLEISGAAELMQHYPNLKGILDEPSVLIAPVFADDSDLVPFKPLTYLIEALGLGIVPTREYVRDLVSKDDLFNECAVVTFESDGISGNAAADPKTKDSPWLIDTLTHNRKTFLTQQLSGGHLTPTGDKVGDVVIGMTLLANVLPLPSIQVPPRQLEPVIVELLNQLGKREAASSHTPKQSEQTEAAPAEQPKAKPKSKKKKE